MSKHQYIRLSGDQTIVWRESANFGQGKKKSPPKLNSLSPGGNFPQSDPAYLDEIQRRFLGLTQAKKIQRKIEGENFLD